MSGDNESKITYRCPVCFSRENDVVLFEKEDGSLYCIKCSFNGKTSDVKEMYTDLKKKYRFLRERITLEGLRNI